MRAIRRLDESSPCTNLSISGRVSSCRRRLGHPASTSKHAFRGRLDTISFTYGDANDRRKSAISRWSPPNSSIPSVKIANFRNRDFSISVSNAFFISTYWGSTSASEGFQFRYNLGKTAGTNSGCWSSTVWRRALSIPT